MTTDNLSEYISRARDKSFANFMDVVNVSQSDYIDQGLLALFQPCMPQTKVHSMLKSSVSFSLVPCCSPYITKTDSLVDLIQWKMRSDRLIYRTVQCLVLGCLSGAVLLYGMWLCVVKIAVLCGLHCGEEFSTIWSTLL